MFAINFSDDECHSVAEIDLILNAVSVSFDYYNSLMYLINGASLTIVFFSNWKQILVSKINSVVWTKTIDVLFFADWVF